MNRHPEWERRLLAYLEHVRRTGWDPVSNNCALFALGAMRAVLLDADARFAQLGVVLPDSAYGAARVLTERGGVRGLAQAFFGTELQPVLRARRGDVLLADADLLIPGSEDRESLGISDGSQALFVGPDGLQHFALASSRGCWAAG